MLSYEYIQFLNEQILPYIPYPRVKTGTRINFRCPFCGDSKKSATKKRAWYYMENASFYCFNCGLSMPGMKLLEALSGNDYASIKKECTRMFLKNSLKTSFEIAEEKQPSSFNFKSIVNKEWKNELTENAKAYLAKRHVLEAPFLKEKLYSVKSKSNNEEFILIPWVVNGIDAYYQLNDFMGYKHIKYIFPKNKNKLVYGLDNIDPTFPYIFAFEGVYDSLFVKNGISTGTKSITSYQMKIIKNRWPRHQICCSFDNDRSGIASMMKLIEKDNGISYFKWFDQTTAQKDINDFVNACGNVNFFANEEFLESHVVDRLQMKMFLMQNGLWKKEPYVFKKASTAIAYSNLAMKMHALSSDII